MSKDTTQIKLTAWLEAQTQKLREAAGVSSDPQVIQLRSMVGSFGCQSKHVADLVAIYTGKPVRNPDRVAVNPGSIVVVMKREAGHNYSVGKPAMCIQGSSFLSFKRGEPAFEGNSLPLRFAGSQPTVRPASPEEVREFVETVGVDAIAKHLAII